MMPAAFLPRAARRVRHEIAAVRHAVAFGRAADGPVSAAAMFAAGLAYATPRRWAGLALAWLGIRRLRLSPGRLGGGALWVNPRDGGHLCIVEEFFVPPLACDLSLVTFTPALILDCGGHIGAFTLIARRRFSSVPIMVFEPNPDNVEWLRANLAANHAAGVSITVAAVSTYAGRGAFGFTPTRSEAGRLEPLGPRADLAERVEVAVVDLAELVRRLAPASLLLKVDIEGEEERLIPVLISVLPQECAVFFETHRGRDGWDAVSAVLSAHMFAVRLLRQHGDFYDGFAIRSPDREVSR